MRHAGQRYDLLRNREAPCTTWASPAWRCWPSLGAGHSPTSGTKYSEVVNDGLKYLRDVQQVHNGNFGIETNPQYTYDHLIATVAMCEAYALTEKRHLKRPAEKALKYMYSIRNPGGAWRYSPDHPDMIVAPNDTSVTGWAIMAMTTAKEAGLEFDADGPRGLDPLLRGDDRDGDGALRVHRAGPASAA